MLNEEILSKIKDIDIIRTWLARDVISRRMKV